MSNTDKIVDILISHPNVDNVIVENGQVVDVASVDVDDIVDWLLEEHNIKTSFLDHGYVFEYVNDSGPSEIKPSVTDAMGDLHNLGQGAQYAVAIASEDYGQGDGDVWDAEGEEIEYDDEEYEEDDEDDEEYDDEDEDNDEDDDEDDDEDEHEDDDDEHDINHYKYDYDINEEIIKEANPFASIERANNANNEALGISPEQEPKSKPEPEPKQDTDQDVDQEEETDPDEESPEEVDPQKADEEAILNFAKVYSKNPVELKRLIKNIGPELARTAGPAVQFLQQISASQNESLDIDSDDDLIESIISDL